MSKDPLLKSNKKDNSRRRFRGKGPRPDNKPVNSETIRKELEERLANWRAKTPEEQLAALDVRLGKGVGAKRQRARLEALITASREEKKSKKSRSA